jgi:hypothetical protein
MIHRPQKEDPWTEHLTFPYILLQPPIHPVNTNIGSENLIITLTSNLGWLSRNYES